MKYLKYCVPIFATMLLTACGGESTVQQTEAVQQNIEENSIAQKSKNNKPSEYVSPLSDEAPVYNAGVFLNSPYYFNNEDGKSVGFDIDLLRAIGEQEGFKVNFIKVDFNKMFTAVDDGRIDIALSGLSLTPERTSKYATSSSYTKCKAGYMLKDSSPYSTIEDMDDKRIGVLEDSNLANIVGSNTHATLLQNASVFLAFQTIFTGKSDAVFGFEANLTSESMQFPEEKFKFIPFSDDVETAMYASKDNQDLIDKVNSGLNKVKQNGKYQQLTAKWFGEKSDKFSVK